MNPFNTITSTTNVSSLFSGGPSGLFGKSTPTTGGGGGGSGLFGTMGSGAGGSGGGLFGFGQQQQQQQPQIGGGGGLFGSMLSKGTQGGGAGGGLFQAQTPSFGVSGTTQPSTSGGLFGSTGSGTGLFGTGGGGGGTVSGGGLFGTRTSGIGTGLGTSQPSTMFGTNLGGGGGNLFNKLGMAKPVGTIGVSWDRSELGKRDNILITSINSMRRLADRSLDELRMEDYFALKNGQVSQQVIDDLQAKWRKNQQEAAGGILIGGGTTGGGPVTGGLFGTRTQTGTTTPLFGGGTQQQAGGGLFGARAGGIGGGPFGAGTQPQQGVGLFGQQQQPQAVGLFGGGGVQLGQQRPGGLFGAPTQPQGGGLVIGGGTQLGQQPQGGLFGTTTVQPTTTGSLFGGPKPQVQAGGIFGQQQQPQGGGLFGGGATQLGQQQQQPGVLIGTPTQQTGGLFGGGAPQRGLFGTTTQPTTGGLITGTATGSLIGQPSGGPVGTPLFSGGGGGTVTGGLFGTQSQTTGGLFSSTAPTQTGGLFAGQTIGGGVGGGLFATPQPVLQIQQVQPQSQPEMPPPSPFTQVTGTPTGVDQGLAQKQYHLFGKTIGADDDDLLFKEARGKDSLLTAALKSPKSKFLPYNVFEKGLALEKDYPKYERSLELLPPSPPSKRRSRRKLKEDSFGILSTSNEPDYLDLDVSTLDELPPEPRQLPFNPEIEQKAEEIQGATLAKVTNSVRFYVVFLGEDEEEREFTIDIDSKRPIFDIKSTILKKIFDTTHLHYSKYKLLHENHLLNEQIRIKDSNLQNHDKIFLVADASTFDNLSEVTATTELTKELVDENLIPKVPKEYQTSPSLVALSRMTEEELSHVKNFSIWNDKAKITFLDEVDLRGLDLGKMIILDHRSIEVYPESRGYKVPEPGTGLNVPTLMEFYGWKLPRKYEDDVDVYVEKLRMWAESMNATLESYDPEKQITKIRLEGFTTGKNW